MQETDLIVQVEVQEQYRDIIAVPGAISLTEVRHQEVAPIAEEEHLVVSVPAEVRIEPRLQEVRATEVPEEAVHQEVLDIEVREEVVHQEVLDIEVRVAVQEVQEVLEVLVAVQEVQEVLEVPVELPDPQEAADLPQVEAVEDDNNPLLNIPVKF